VRAVRGFFYMGADFDTLLADVDLCGSGGQLVIT